MTDLYDLKEKKSKATQSDQKATSFRRRDAQARPSTYGGSADAFCIETSASVNGIRMTSFCHSLQEAPSSIIQTMTDEFEAVLMELRSYSLDTLERKCEKRSNTFATVRGEAKKTFCRLQDMPKKYEVPISKIQRSIDELKNRNKAEDEEKDALVRRLSEFDEVERKRKAEVEKLREKDELMEAVIELNNENIDLINSGFPIIQRIEKRFPCPHPV
ncbi:hypothetical protein RB195_008440 [Necator americanus]|uniref:Uncharacterized protein n=1 Tax=Necator americanus TaxID=51031 RepID=A0ABR1CQ52_NECAM